MFRSMLLSVALVVAASSICEAGGGTSKSGGSIRFTNKSKTQIALVVVDPSTSLQAATNVDQFKSRGGKILTSGKSSEFTKLKEGKHVIGTLLVAPGTTAVTAAQFTRSDVTVTKGKRVQINL